MASVTESSLSNSVLVLYRSYPGDPDLKAYLSHAIQEGMISVSTFVTTLLQAARSPELHSLSIVPLTALTPAILNTIQDALALLRTAHSLSISQFHHLTESASELVILLFSCVSDLSQISTAQAMDYFADASEILHTFPLTPDVRQVLETFVVSLNLLLGDDAKIAREAQMMHTMQLALGKGDLLGPASETDIVTLSLLLHHIVCILHPVFSRAHRFGSGWGANPVVLLMGVFRWTSWSPKIFYRQLLLAALTSLARSSSDCLGWKFFIIGRLPHLLVIFENFLKGEGLSHNDLRGGLQNAIASVFHNSDLVSQCEHTLARVVRPRHTEDYIPGYLLRDLLQQLINVELIDTPFAVELDPLISNESIPRLHTEAQEAGVDFESYMDSKLSPEITSDDFRIWMDRVERDLTSHDMFSQVILKKITSLTSVLDAESLSHICQILYTCDTALDILAIHIKISDLVLRALSFLEEYDCETVGDPQTAVSHLGNVILLLNIDTLTAGHDSVPLGFLQSTDVVYFTDHLSAEDAGAFAAWFKALFDSGSEGIEDTILRSTQPKTLLRISATLFSQAIKANLAQKIDTDILNNGVSYFTGPLLNWTLVGNAQIHLQILQTLLLSPSCPRPVLSLCDKNWNVAAFDVVTVRRVVIEALGIQGGSTPHPPRVQVSLQEYSRRTIQDVMTAARAGKAPILDVEHCLKFTPPTQFLNLLWSELVLSANLGDLENSKRIATFVLTMPHGSTSPPLLPIFLHIVTPKLIALMDDQPSEQAVNIELLVTVICSSLTAALYLEFASRSVPGDRPFSLGQPCTAMARRFASDLRARKHSHTSNAIFQRLASSQAFVANFPAFMSD
ncbi:hypothetical protein BD779DRAFT_1607403 [Infundibulicybe gibba]|nr:hypothetical protein BD779DRAFT_1607403 [Infundibulicybe gibba]